MTEQLVRGKNRHRVLAQLSADVQGSAEFRRQIEENGVAEWLVPISLQLAQALLPGVERKLMHAGLEPPVTDARFFEAWRELSAANGREPLPPGADWLGDSGLEITRGDPVVPPKPPGITLVEAGALIRAAVEAAVSKPEQTTSDVAVLDGDGAVVKRSQVVTRRTSA